MDNLITLHDAIMYCCPLQVIQWLLDCDHHDLTENDDGMLPIHLVCIYHQVYEVVYFFATTTPLPLYHFDSKGELPLHHLLKSGMSVKFV